LGSRVSRKFGISTDNFTFYVFGGNFSENKHPNIVQINFILDNGTINSYDMDLDNTYVGSNMTIKEFKKTIAFSSISGMFRGYYFFNASFSDGNVSTLFNKLKDNDNELIINRELFNDITVNPDSASSNNAPHIIDYNILSVNIETKTEAVIENSIIPVGDSSRLRFMVWIHDLDGDHSDHLDYDQYLISPSISFQNLKDDEFTQNISMKWRGKGFDPYPELDAYYVDISPGGYYSYSEWDSEIHGVIDLYSGSWKVKFDVVDNTSNSDQIYSDDQRIWHIGRTENILSTMLFGYIGGSGQLFNKIPIPGIGPVYSSIVGFTQLGLGLLSLGGAALNNIAKYLSIGLLVNDMALSMLGLYSFVTSPDSSTLLGLGLNFFWQMIGMGIAYALGTTTDIFGKKFNPKNLKIITGISFVLYLFNTIIRAYCNPQTLATSDPLIMMFNKMSGGPQSDLDMPAETEITQILSPIVGFTSLILSIFSLSAVLNILSMKKVTVGFELPTGIIAKQQTSPIIKTTKYFVIFKGIISILSFVLFFYHSGFFHILGGK
jgi:hypothetical protein